MPSVGENLVLEGAQEPLPLLEGHDGVRQKILKSRCRDHRRGYTEEASLGADDGCRKGNRINPASQLGGFNVPHDDPVLPPRSLKPGHPADVPSHRRWVGGRHNPPLLVRHPQPTVDRVRLLRPGQVGSQVGSVMGVGGKDPRHHLHIAVPLEEDQVDFIGNVRRRQGQAFPGALDEAVPYRTEADGRGDQGDRG